MVSATTEDKKEPLREKIKKDAQGVNQENGGGYLKMQSGPWCDSW